MLCFVFFCFVKLSTNNPSTHKTNETLARTIKPPVVETKVDRDNKGEWGSYRRKIFNFFLNGELDENFLHSINIHDDISHLEKARNKTLRFFYHSFQEKSSFLRKIP